LELSAPASVGQSNSRHRNPPRAALKVRKTMRIINLDPGIHFTIGETDTIELTIDGLEKISREVRLGNTVQIVLDGFVVFRCPPTRPNVVPLHKPPGRTK
jgi:hypothetical protein